MGGASSGGAESGGTANGGTGLGGAPTDGGTQAGGWSPWAGGEDSAGGSPEVGGDGAGGTSEQGGANNGGDAAGSAGSEPGSGGSPPEPGPFFPAPDSTDQCPDPSIRLRFDGTPRLGSNGSIRVYDAANPGSPVAQVNLGTSQITDTIGGSQFNLPRPAFVDGNEAIFVLPSAGLEYGHTYYVTVDQGAITGPNGDGVSISDPEQWRFTVADSAPSNNTELRVALDGTGQFCSIQGAINAAASNGTTVTIEPGAYYGVVYFKGKNGLSLIGTDRETTRIAGVNNNNLNPSTRGRALFGTEDISALTIENLTIENQTPQGGSQAEALALLSCDQCIVRNCTVHSLQDTLLWSGRIYAEDSLIEGNVDYIWGTGAAYFNRCEIKTIGRQGYNVQARNSNSNYGYVFVDSQLTSDPGISGDVLARIDVSAYPNSHVAYIDCEMGSHISAAGWTVTGGGNTSGLRFWEYQSRSPGGNLVNTSQRTAGSRQLNESEAAQMRDAGVVLNGWDPR